MNSQTTDDFWRMYHNLPENIRQAAQKAYKLFSTDPSHPGLRFHRLQGGTSQFWSVRITKDYRAVGSVTGNTIIWFWIGNHVDFDREFFA